MTTPGIGNKRDAELALNNLNSHFGPDSRFVDKEIDTKVGGLLLKITDDEVCPVDSKKKATTWYGKICQFFQRKSKEFDLVNCTTKIVDLYEIADTKNSTNVFKKVMYINLTNKVKGAIEHQINKIKSKLPQEGEKLSKKQSKLNERVSLLTENLKKLNQQTPALTTNDKVELALYEIEKASKSLNYQNHMFNQYSSQSTVMIDDRARIYNTWCGCVKSGYDRANNELEKAENQEQQAKEALSKIEELESDPSLGEELKQKIAEAKTSVATAENLIKEMKIKASNMEKPTETTQPDSRGRTSWIFGNIFGSKKT